MASENPSVGFILEAFRKLSIRANNHQINNLKHKQEKAVNCLSEERDHHVFAVMPTGCSEHFIFKLFGTAVMINKVHEGQRSVSVVFVMPANQHNSGSGKGGKVTWLRLCYD